MSAGHLPTVGRRGRYVRFSQSRAPGRRSSLPSSRPEMPTEPSSHGHLVQWDGPVFGTCVFRMRQAGVQEEMEVVPNGVCEPTAQRNIGNDTQRINSCRWRNFRSLRPCERNTGFHAEGKIEAAMHPMIEWTDHHLIVPRHQRCSLLVAPVPVYFPKEADAAFRKILQPAVQVDVRGRSVQLEPRTDRRRDAHEPGRVGRIAFLRPY